MAPNTSGTTDVAGSAQAVAGTAKDKAGEVTSTATEQASQVASTAADQARQVGHQAADQALNLVDEARRTAWEKGEASTGQIADALGRLRDQANALLEGRPEDAGPLREHGRTAVDRLDTVTRRLETDGLQGTLRDVQSFARRRPAAFLAGAGLLGFAAGRLVRAGRDGSDSGLRSNGSGGNGSGGPVVAIPPRTSPATYPDAPYPDPGFSGAGYLGTPYPGTPYPGGPAGVDDPTRPLPPVAGMAPPPPPPPYPEPPLPPNYLER